MGWSRGSGEEWEGVVGGESGVCLDGTSAQSVEEGFPAWWLDVQVVGGV